MKRVTDYVNLRPLVVDETVIIRRTSGAEQRARVTKVPDPSGWPYRAPELTAFEVTFDTKRGQAWKWCDKLSLIACNEHAPNGA